MPMQLLLQLVPLFPHSHMQMTLHNGFGVAVYMKAGTGNLIARIHGEHLFRLGVGLGNPDGTKALYAV